MKNILLIFLFIFLMSSVWAEGNSEQEPVQETEEEQYTIGVTFESLGYVFIQSLHEVVEATAKELGINIIFEDANSNPSAQLQHIDSFIASKVDAIIVNSINNDVAIQISEKVVPTDIPLVFLNRAAPKVAVPTGKKVANVASPERQAGAQQAKYVVDTLAARGITEGNVVILLGGIGTTPQIERTKGVKEYLAANAPGIKVLHEQTATWIKEDAKVVIEAWLEIGDEFVAVFANNDEMALGASLALTEAGVRDKVIIVGVDATDDALQAIKDGRLDMTLFQNFSVQAEAAVETAVKMIKGKPFSQTVEMSFEPVTADNVSQYLNH